MRSFRLFFFNDTATTEIYTLSLHDALPISERAARRPGSPSGVACRVPPPLASGTRPAFFLSSSSSCPASPTVPRSEEHTSELQSRQYLVCRLLLEKKNMISYRHARHSSSRR